MSRMSKMAKLKPINELRDSGYYRQGYEQGYKQGKQEVLDVLNKIRAEIKEEYGDYYICDWWEDYDWDENDISEYVSVGSIEDVLEIIDKYRNLCYNGGEVEEEEEKE